MSPVGRVNIPPGGLPSRPRTWRGARRVDFDYIQELERELCLARGNAKDLERELIECRELLKEAATAVADRRARMACR